MKKINIADAVRENYGLIITCTVKMSESVFLGLSGSCSFVAAL